MLEVLDDESALMTHTAGPFRVIKLLANGTVALLTTGVTDSKDAQQFTRAVTTLARYYTKRQPPPAI